MLSLYHKVIKISYIRNLSMSIFTQKLNSLSGKTVWEIQDENYDYELEIARSAFADMLHDTERNQMYFDALKIAIDKMHSLGKKANVLDIGTGTGLLSMMAVKCGADSVVACEAFSPIGACAQKVIDLNKFSDIIKVVAKHSTDLTVGENCDLPQKANILVTEVFDTELIGEGALGTFKHAHKELLEGDCIVIPDSGVIYAQVVETTFAQTWNRFKDVYSLDGELLVQAPTSIKDCLGSPAVHDLQLSQLPFDSFEEVIPPQPVFHFDWSGKDSIEYDRCNVQQVKAKRNGVAQVVFMWWDLFMDQDKKIILSCAPHWAHPSKLSNPKLDIPWRDHWMQAVYYLPQEVNVAQNEELNLVSCHDQHSLWFYVENKNALFKNYEKYVCECTFHMIHSRNRIGQMNDNVKNKKYLSVMEKNINNDSVILIVGDEFYFGLAAAKLGAKQVLCLSENNLNILMYKSFVECNKFENVEVLKSVESLKESRWLKDINLILAEPQFSTTIFPWDGLYYLYLIKDLRSCFSESCKIAPTKCSIKAIVVEFKDLQKIKQPLEHCFEFDMKPFDDLIMDACLKCDPVIEAQPLWEYPCTARSSIMEIANINCETMFEQKTISTTNKFDVGTSQYNGVAFWVEWSFDSERNTVISTGPTTIPKIGEVIQWDMHTKQGVHFLQQKMEKEVKSEFTLNVEDGTYNINFS